MQWFRGAICLLLVTTLVASQFAGVVGATASGASSDTEALAVAQTDIDIVGVDMPDEIEPGNEYKVQVRIRNNGESAQNVEVAYLFEGRKLMYYDELVPAGETIEGSLPLTVRDLSRSHRETLHDGQYTHSMSVGGSEVSRDVLITGLGTPTPTPTAIGDSDTSVSSDESVSLVSLDFPDQIPIGGSADVQIRTRNPSDQLAPADVRLSFDGREVITDTIDFPPGEETISLPIDYQMLTSGPGELEPGTYSWEMSVAGTVESGTIEIVESDGSGSASTGADGDSNGEATGGEAQPDEPERGFFTNGESGPAFLDSFSLTVGGFVLSAVGIFYQMLQGA